MSTLILELQVNKLTFFFFFLTHTFFQHKYSIFLLKWKMEYLCWENKICEARETSRNSRIFMRIFLYRKVEEVH